MTHAATAELALTGPKRGNLRVLKGLYYLKRASWICQEELKT
jgi:hypothetical protein